MHSFFQCKSPLQNFLDPSRSQPNKILTTMILVIKFLKSDEGGWLEGVHQLTVTPEADGVFKDRQRLQLMVATNTSEIPYALAILVRFFGEHIKL